MRDPRATLERELGTTGIVAGFTGRHQPRSPQEADGTWMVHGIAGSLLELGIWIRGAAARRGWDHDRRLPIGRVVVGVTDTEALIGVAGSVHARWDLNTAFGRVCNLNDPTWVEVGGSKIWVVGRDLEEALRIRGDVLARNSTPPGPPGSSSRPAPPSEGGVPDA